jgi:hypothetical protein
LTQRPAGSTGGAFLYDQQGKGPIMAKPDILIVDGHGFSCLCELRANSLRIGRKAKPDNPRFSNFRPIAAHAPNARQRAGIGSQPC